MYPLIITFDNEGARDNFMSWLDGSGEQSYFQECDGIYPDIYYDYTTYVIDITWAEDVT